ncbi:MAG: hypothetical protein CK428_22835 [Mycobacterium sp.]|nr:MAG: hypothetical protein CK428_22835 [Mycobacterium sp.]
MMVDRAGTATAPQGRSTRIISTYLPAAALMPTNNPRHDIFTQASAGTRNLGLHAPAIPH